MSRKEPTPVTEGISKPLPPPNPPSLEKFNMVKLSKNHWAIEKYNQQMTIKDWKRILLEYGNTIIFMGVVRQLKAKYIGGGFVEVYKKRETESQYMKRSGLYQWK